jgi:hypothetical protein
MNSDVHASKGKSRWTQPPEIAQSVAENHHRTLKDWRGQESF